MRKVVRHGKWPTELLLEVINDLCVGQLPRWRRSSCSSTKLVWKNGCHLLWGAWQISLFGEPAPGMSQVRKVRKKSVKNSRSEKSGKGGENACKVSKIFYFDLNILKTVLWLWSRRRFDKQSHRYSQTFSSSTGEPQKKWSHVVRKSLGKVRKFRKYDLMTTLRSNKRTFSCKMNPFCAMV